MASAFAGRACWRAATRIPPAITQMATMTVAFPPIAARRFGGVFPRVDLTTRVGFFEGIDMLLAENVRVPSEQMGCPAARGGAPVRKHRGMRRLESRIERPPGSAS